MLVISNLLHEGVTAPRQLAVNKPRWRYWYSEAEVRAALCCLSEVEIKELQGIAGFHFMGNSALPGHVEVEDLFMEAVLRTLEGKRKWRRGVSFRAHLLSVVRSIAHQRFTQAARYTSLSEHIADSRACFSSVLDAQSSVVRLSELLRGDPLALSVLESMKNEMRPRDARKSLGIRAKVYWAARKRIRRLAERLSGANGIAAP